MKIRLDQELVRRGLAPSREQAQALIANGAVYVGGIRATKSASQVTQEVSISLRESDEGYASRGAYKLVGALDHFEISVADLRILDAGASTGGFTDVLLRRGAREVLAVDVGYGQMIYALQQDPRVRLFDRTNVRHLTSEMIGGKVDMCVADLSFISLTLVLPALADLCTHSMLVMVKPQFEVGKERLGPGGVVRDPLSRIDAIEQVQRAAGAVGWQAKGVVASPLPGPSGNVEYFLWLHPGAAAIGSDEIRRAVETGPQ